MTQITFITNTGEHMTVAAKDGANNLATTRLARKLRR